jgi:hypothetical protein
LSGLPSPAFKNEALPPSNGSKFKMTDSIIIDIGSFLPFQKIKKGVDHNRNLTIGINFRVYRIIDITF